MGSDSPASVPDPCVQLQLSGKKPPDIDCTDLLGNTPLHSAAYRGQKQCALKLLRSGASPNIKNQNGKDPQQTFGPAGENTGVSEEASRGSVLSVGSATVKLLLSLCFRVT